MKEPDPRSNKSHGMSGYARSIELGDAGLTPGIVHAGEAERLRSFRTATTMPLAGIHR